MTILKGLALDRYVHITSTRTPRMTGTIARDDPTTQETVGRAAAALRAARAFYYEAIGTIESIMATGRIPPIDQRANARLAFAHAAETAKLVVRMLHDDAGGSGLYEAHGLHHIFRDVHAAAQHAQLQRTGFRNSGRVILGLDPGSPRL